MTAALQHYMILCSELPFAVFPGILFFPLDNDYILWYERKILQYIGETVSWNSWFSRIDEEEE
jgi:hypothetical protein